MYVAHHAKFDFSTPFVFVLKPVYRPTKQMDRQTDWRTDGRAARSVRNAASSGGCLLMELVASSNGSTVEVRTYNGPTASCHFAACSIVLHVCQSVWPIRN